MKKILMFLCCLFCSVTVVYAKGYIDNKLTSYGVTIDDWYISMNVFIDEYNNRAFSMNPFMVATGDTFEVSTDSNNAFGFTKSDVELFKTIVYYGYLENPSEENYFYTQIMIWRKILGLNANFTEYDINTYFNDYYEKMADLENKINNHYKKYEMTNKIWERVLIPSKNIYVPNNELEVIIEDDGINIYNKNVGEFKLDYNLGEENIRLFEYSGMVYFSSIGGPEIIKDKITYNVKGINVSLNEVNNFKQSGDSISKLNYELYQNDKLLLKTDKLNFYVQDNSNYTLKVQDSYGIEKINDINFSTEESDLKLNIEKNIKKNKVKFSITNDLNYEIYLKSNNELYGVVNKDNFEIFLPYGEYVIKTKDLEIKDFIVSDNYFLDLCLHNKFEVKEDISKNEDKKDQELTEDKKIEIKKESLNTNVNESNIDNNDVSIPNPKTNDLNTLFLFTLIISLILILIILIIFYKKLVNKLKK